MRQQLSIDKLRAIAVQFPHPLSQVRQAHQVLCGYEGAGNGWRQRTVCGMS